MKIYFRIPFTHYWLAKYSLYTSGDSYKGFGLAVKLWDNIKGIYHWKQVI
jgi:hypothetical protein